MTRRVCCATRLPAGCRLRRPVGARRLGGDRRARAPRQGLTDSGFAVAASGSAFRPLRRGRGPRRAARRPDRGDAAARRRLAPGAVVAAGWLHDRDCAVLALTALLGVVFAISSRPSSRLSRRSPADRVQEANGHVETARYIGFGIGPVLGGLLFAAAGSSWRCWSTRRPSRLSPARRWRCASPRPRTPEETEAHRAPATASRSSSATGCCRW